ncbi:MAG TPA: DUF116 domain-containing protein [Methanothermobacter sp.]|jgi:hypothetical protein|nr:DUF116 domain-containing protein [Methanothermobacter tenebrarum]MDD3455284.1 DUF116 domain-containing protein [Methanobacteriales archaeon]MDI6881340.1 DUF116 domain-containing protein [Methanothermobacter sp.]HHW15876.1 DUF116 domain-containing protein [Methanothermobacter sp.]HOQ20708.1 DUF116 domain-containing protein [Methanothermobacter sp.]
MMIDFYQLFGQLISLLIVGILLLLLVSLFLGRMLLRSDRLIFPRLLLVTVNLFYGPFKQLAGILGLDESIVDQIGVEVRNKINREKFDNIKAEDKLLILPHCLRHPKCEAPLEPSGLQCKNCKKCVIGILKKKAEEIGYRVFIIPGSTFLKRIIKENKFKSVLGVACYQDLNMAMMKLSKFTPQGVPLLKDGCYKTKVDVSMVLEKMGIKKPRRIRLECGADQRWTSK